mgnify:CR=1 FL=1
MDPYDRFTRRSLRDVLVADGVLTNEQADDLVESAYETSEPFGYVVVESGHLTPWELMKRIAASYQMPVVPLEGYRLPADLIETVPATLLYQHQVLPLGSFGQSWTWACATPPTKDLIDSLREHCGPSHFFFVGDMTVIQRMLQDNVRVLDVTADDAWTGVFDAGEEAVREEVGDEAV